MLVAPRILQPETKEEVLALLSEWGDEAKVVAGSTALVLMFKANLIAPAALVSVRRLQGLADIHRTAGGGLSLGALATLRTAEMSDEVRRANPTLAETFGVVANVRVRNAATVGGNLCEADYASDPPQALLALGTRVTVESMRGERTIALEDFFRDYYETSIEADELLTRVDVDPLPDNCGTAYFKYVSRSSEDRPCVGVAAAVQLDAVGNCRRLRVVVGAVGPVPVELPDVEREVAGRPVTSESAKHVAEEYSRQIEPIADLRGSKEYRKQMVKVFVARAISQASERAGATHG